MKHSCQTHYTTNHTVFCLTGLQEWICWHISRHISLWLSDVHLNPQIGDISVGGAFAIARFIPVWLILSVLVPKAPSTWKCCWIERKQRYQSSDDSRGVGITACHIILPGCPQHVKVKAAAHVDINTDGKHHFSQLKRCFTWICGYRVLVHSRKNTFFQAATLF